VQGVGQFIEFKQVFRIFHDLPNWRRGGCRVAVPPAARSLPSTTADSGKTAGGRCGRMASIAMMNSQES
jgi:hypothetical protein